ncbi:MAG: NAD(P)-dependent oxidoreductase [Armatimonadota bacterium]|jgi:3-hydroxyisobutyrate dehydrogenase-like beta-hydroxyacid dehydrogenase
MSNIGFIGLGAMGKPMALNLLKAGHTLRVYNRTKSKMEPLVAAGALATDTCSEAAAGADVVISIVSDSADAREVILGSSGALAGAKKGAIIVDMSTISPSVAMEIGDSCKMRGFEFLDAPVTGGEAGATNATLSIMVGGNQEALEAVRPILLAMASKITYMGPSGSGQTAKMCNQVICALNILAVSEGMALAEAAGLDRKVLLHAMQGGAADSWMLDNLAPKMVEDDWEPGFRIALQQKDVRLALELAAWHSLPLFGTATVQQVLRSAASKGWGDEGTQALVKAIKEMAGKL